MPINFYYRLYKAFFICLLIVATHLGCYSQFAVVKSQQGYTICKSEKGIRTKNQDTLFNGSLLYIVATQEKWVKIIYHKHGKDSEGWMPEGQLKQIDKFQALTTVPNTGTDNVILKSPRIAVRITTRVFNRSAHVLKYNQEAPGIVEFIDGKIYYGGDGEIPGYEYASIVVRSGSVSRVLPAKALIQLYEPNLSSVEAFYSETDDTLYITASNGDGAGYYEVVWRIVGGRYADRFVASGF